MIRPAVLRNELEGGRGEVDLATEALFAFGRLISTQAVTQDDLFTICSGGGRGLPFGALDTQSIQMHV